MLVLLTEKMVAGRGIVLPLIFEAIKQVFFRVSEFILDLAHNDIVYFFFIVRQLLAHLLINNHTVGLLSLAT